MTMHLTATLTGGVTYQFHTSGPGFRSWALCTVNDATGELNITSDYGNWSHRWDPSPHGLGAPNLTAFIGTRTGVDYLARKLQREGRDGRRWSAAMTARELRQRLCEVRLAHGREQIGNRLEPEDMPDGKPIPRLLRDYAEDGLPIYSNRRVDAPTWDNPHRKESLPYLTLDTARRIWVAIGDLADDVRGCNGDLFYERVQQIEGFSDYVTEEPWEYGETEQTPEDRALREIVLPALIEACRAKVSTTVPALESSAP